MGEGEVKFGNLSATMQGILTLLLIVGVVVPCVLGFVNFDKRLDLNEEAQNRHIEKDDKFREKITDEVDSIEDDVHNLQLIDKELEMKYAEILRRFDEQREQFNEMKSLQRESNAKIDNLVRAE